MAPTTQPAQADQDAEIEAEYTLESPARCPACKANVSTVHVIRMLRTKVNFTSSLPRRGLTVVCPSCRSFVPATVGGILG